MITSTIKNSIYRFLRWSERYTQTDMIYLAKGGFWLFLGQCMAMLSGFILTVGYANLLPQDIYGSYKFILSLIGILGAFTLTGMGTAITKAVAQGDDGALITGYKAKLKWSIIMALAAYAGAFYYFMNANTTIAISLIIAGSFNPLFTSASLYGAYLTGKKDFKTNTLYNIVQNIIPAAFLLITIFFSQNLIVILLVYFISNTIVTSALYYRTVRKVGPNQVVGTSTISNAKHLSLMDILGTVAGHLDKILIFHFLGPAQLAIYTLAIGPPIYFRVFHKIIGTLVLPKFSQRSIKELTQAIPTKTLKFFAFMSIVVTVYIFIAPTFYNIFFPQYLESIIYSQIFSLSLLFPSLFFTQLFVAHMKKKELYIFKLSTSLLEITLLFVLLPIYGIWGAISTIIITKATKFFLSLFLFKKLQ